MARLPGPDMGSRAVFLPDGRPAASRTGVVYADAAGTTLADIRAHDGTSTPGAPITDSTVTVDAYGLLPVMWFPDGVDRLWISVNDGPLVPIDADYNARLDALADPAYAFNVTRYGAKGDGVSDDTAAIQAAIDAAFAHAQANSGYAEVVIPPAANYYAINGPLKQGGATKGNAQLAIPIQPMEANKVTLVFKGSGDGSGLPTWLQTVPQRTGSVLRSSIAGTLHGTYGEASVLGCPTPQQGYATTGAIFNNVNIVIDGIEVMVPNTVRGADMCGVDLRSAANANIVSLGVFVDRPPTTITVGQGSGWAFGLALPQPANNAKNNVYSYSCEGFTYGLWATEHLAAVNVLCVYCYTGILIIGSFSGSTGAQHIAWIGNACVEACTNGVQWVAGGKAVIDVLTVEGGFDGGQHVADTNGQGTGYVGIGGIINTIKVSDPTKVRVVYLDGTSGAATPPPAIPPSGTALRNPYWRDCWVTVTGGTVTSIAVDGQVTGLTSGGVFVPSGRKITLTYSAAPTWTWTKA